MTKDIVLWLDLAEANDVPEDAVQARLPSGAEVLRLSGCGAEQHPNGTPSDWRRSLDAIRSLVRDARERARQAGRSRFWVTGRAGLPGFIYLGHLLSKHATAVTFLHQSPRGGPVTELVLDALPRAEVPYFQRDPASLPPTEASAPVALAISSIRRVHESQVSEAMAARGATVRRVVRAHAEGPLDERTAGAAMHEIEEVLAATCDAHPQRSTLALFVAGPTSLAFLAGGALAPRACRNVQVFEYEGDRYRLAFELPYPPVPERGKVLLLQCCPRGERSLALDQEMREIRLEQSSGRVTDRLDIHDVPAAQPKDILRQIDEYAPQVVHFSGHGTTGELLFQDERGVTRPVSTADLSEAMRTAGTSVRLAVLSACYSESHVEALLAHVDCVVAMRGPVWDNDARRFAVAFYRRLAEGESVRSAYDYAHLAMRLDRASGPGRSRDPVLADLGDGAAASAQEEPVKIFERDRGCARDLFVVRRR